MEIKKPIKRNRLRQIFGKEFYILKRKFNWSFSNTKWSVVRNNEFFENSLFLT